MAGASELVAYVSRVFERTYEAAAIIPDDLVDWRPRDGELSMGEVVAHIAAARHMTSRVLAGEPMRYEGHDLPPLAGANFVRRLAEHSATVAMARLRGADLEREVATVSGALVPAWQMLISGLVEHEVHHRSQLCEYLGMNGIAPPPLYGLHAEDLPR